MLIPKFINLSALPIPHERAKYAQKAGAHVLTASERETLRDCLSDLARRFRAAKTSPRAWDSLMLDPLIFAKKVGRIGGAPARVAKRISNDIPQKLATGTPEDAKAMFAASLVAYSELKKIIEIF